MKPCVLIAAPPVVSRRLAAALGPTFAVIACPERERARALIEVASLQAIVLVESFADVAGDRTDAPLIRVAATTDAAQVRDEVLAAVVRRRVDECRRAGDLSALTQLPYDEYIDLTRFRATHRYLLGLMRRHHGSVTEASRSAGMMRESLHRLLRQHDVHADRFRQDDLG